MKPQVLLTFDLEEFDLPLEFSCPVSVDDQIEISNEGLKRLTGILTARNIPATFFTTSFYAGKNQVLMKELSANHEIASHSKYHSSFSEGDMAESRIELQKITGQEIRGFRMPRFSAASLLNIKEAGYSYDSSLNPTFIPGRYNKLSSPRLYYTDNESRLAELPVSVSPVMRFPLFWLSFKNLPFAIYLNMCRRVMRKDSYLHLYFHPWEFADLASLDIPRYIKRLSGNALAERFEKLLAALEEEGEFSTVSDFLRKSGLTI